jgi:hypothetical protein
MQLTDARDRAARITPEPWALANLSAEQRAYQVRVNRAHGVRPPVEELDASRRSAYVVWWARSLDARDARLRALALERQARQDAALLPKASGHEPRKRVDAVVMTSGTDAYPATVLLDRRVNVKIDPRTRRTITGGRVAYEAVVTKANGAHLHGKPVSKGQTFYVPNSMIDGVKVVAEATPKTSRTKRNASKQRAKRTAQAAPVKRAAKTPTPKVKAVRDTGPSRAEIERAAATIGGHNNIASK